MRWWFYVFIPGSLARSREARQGVADHGFRFARGGLAPSVPEAEAQIARSRELARAEIRDWQHQPSHMLGPNGDLIPLGEVVPELTA